MKSVMPAQEVLTRRHLPHWYVPGAAHFITFRLAGTIPRALIDQWREECAAALRHPVPEGVSRAEHRKEAHRRYFVRMDRYLDQGGAIDWLGHPAVAALVRASLYHHHGRTCHLIAYCLMPNHGHVLLQLLDPGPMAAVAEQDEVVGEQPDKLSPLASTMQSFKSYTAHEANKILNRSGAFWQGESYDHWVRDVDELARIIAYIANNPVKAGLVKHPYEWFWGSAHDRYLQDGSEEGWVDLPLPPEEISRERP
jgi:putative DNA methylase